MAKVYANLIMKGKKKIDDVPEQLKQEVIQILIDAGWVWNDEGDN